MKLLIVLAMITAALNAQQFMVEKVSGTVKALYGSSEEWTVVTPGSAVGLSTTLLTDKNSSITITGNGIRFTLKPSAVITAGAVKTMTVDELLLALALEEITGAPKTNQSGSSRNTAVYGTDAKEKTKGLASGSELGLLRLNGALQLAESGFSESAVVAAREAFRKHPEMRQNTFYRIYFANLLLRLNLINEAYADFSAIKNLQLTAKETAEVTTRLDELKKKLAGMQ